MHLEKVAGPHRPVRRVRRAARVSRKTVLDRGVLVAGVPTKGIAICKIDYKVISNIQCKDVQ